jgi:hypothetical protein
LQSCRYHGLSASAVAGSPHDRVDAGPDLGHLLVVAVVVRPFEPARGEVGRVLLEELLHDPLGDVGPAVHREVDVGEPAGLQDREVLEPPLLPARLEVGEPLGIGRLVVAHVDRRRGALEHEQIAARPGEMGDALHRGRAGADDAHPPVAEPVHRSALRVAAGVVVVPPAGVEAVAAERLDARDAGQLRAMQRPGSDADEPGGEPIAPVRDDDPPGAIVVPLEPGHLGGQQGVVVQAEVTGDATGVLEDLGAVRVLLGRHVAGLFEQRQVDERRGVALRARVPVPVPGAADVAALLDQANLLDAGLPELRTRDEPGEAPADEGDEHVVEHGLARLGLDVRVVDEVGEGTGDLDVLLVAVGPKPLVALDPVLVEQRVAVDPHGAHASNPDTVGRRRSGRSPFAQGR